MIRTQIQLPDELYQSAKKLSARREISLAELTRRGLEYMVSVYAEESGTPGEWAPPAPQDLGWKGLDEDKLKAASRPDPAL